MGEGGQSTHKKKGLQANQCRVPCEQGQRSRKGQQGGSTQGDTIGRTVGGQTFDELHLSIDIDLLQQDGRVVHHGASGPHALHESNLPKHTTTIKVGSACYGSTHIKVGVMGGGCRGMPSKLFTDPPVALAVPGWLLYQCGLAPRARALLRWVAGHPPIKQQQQTGIDLACVTALHHHRHKSTGRLRRQKSRGKAPAGLPRRR